jgi:hypothetical protein
MIDRLRRLSLILAPALLIAGLFLGVGCDTDSTSSAIDVSPSSVVLKKGQSATFTASGGYEYTWSLDPDDGSGQLNTLKGPTVKYTCLSTNGATPKKVVVTSTIEGTSTSSSSSTTSNSTTTTSAYREQGFAQIFFPGGGDGSTSISSLSVSPSSATIGTNATKIFTVTGGTSPYNWLVSDSGKGSCSPTTGNFTTYTASGAGTFTLTCVDSASRRVDVSITQNP